MNTFEKSNNAKTRVLLKFPSEDVYIKMSFFKRSIMGLAIQPKPFTDRPGNVMTWSALNRGSCLGSWNMSSNPSNTYSVIRGTVGRVACVVRECNNPSLLSQICIVDKWTPPSKALNKCCFLAVLILCEAPLKTCFLPFTWNSLVKFSKFQGMSVTQCD